MGGRHGNPIVPSDDQRAATRTSERGGADGVAPGNRRFSDDLADIFAVQLGEHPADHPTVDSTDHRMLGCDIAERAMVVDDPQLVIATVGVRSEAVSGQGVSNGTNRRTQRPVPVVEGLAVQTGRHGPAVLSADLLSESLSLDPVETGQCPAEQRQDQVVTANRELLDRSSDR